MELPSLRFVKETSKSGNLIMEAVVIDVTDENFESALAANAAADDERTEDDFDNLSITDEIPEGILPQDKFTSEFIDRAFSQSDDVPKAPPRTRRSATSTPRPESAQDQIKSSEDSYYSVAQKQSKSQADDHSSSSGPKSESFATARDSEPIIKRRSLKKKNDEPAFQVAAIEVSNSAENSAKDDLSAGKEGKPKTKKSRSRSSSLDKSKKRRSKKSKSPGSVSSLSSADKDEADAKNKAAMDKIDKTLNLLEKSKKLQEGLATIELQTALDISAQKQMPAQFSSTAQKLQLEIAAIEKDIEKSGSPAPENLQKLAQTASKFNADLEVAPKPSGLLAKTFDVIVATTKEFCQDVAQAVKDVVIEPILTIEGAEDTNTFEDLQRGLMEVARHLSPEAPESEHFLRKPPQLVKQLSGEKPLMVLAESTRNIKKAVMEKQSSLESEHSIDLEQVNRIEALSECNKTFEHALELIEKHSNFEFEDQADQPAVAMAVAQCSRELHKAIQLIEEQAALEVSVTNEASELQELAQSARELQEALLQVEMDMQIQPDLIYGDDRFETVLSETGIKSMSMSELNQTLAHQMAPEINRALVSAQNTVLEPEALSMGIEKIDTQLGSLQKHSVEKNAATSSFVHAVEEGQSISLAYQGDETMAAQLDVSVKKATAAVSTQQVLETAKPSQVEEVCTSKASQSLQSCLVSGVQEPVMLMEERDTSISEMQLTQANAKLEQCLVAGTMEATDVFEERDKSAAASVIPKLAQATQQVEQCLEAGIQKVETVLEERDASIASMAMDSAVALSNVEACLHSGVQSSDTLFDTRDASMSSGIGEESQQAVAGMEPCLETGVKRSDTVLEERDVSFASEKNPQQIRATESMETCLQTGVHAIANVLEERDVSISSAPTLKLEKASKTIEDGFATGVVGQAAVYEEGDASMSTQSGVTSLETLAKSVEEFHRGVATIQQQVILDASLGSMSDQASLAQLKALATSASLFHDALLNVEEQIVMESTEPKQDEIAVAALAEAKLAFEIGIALIEQQIVMEGCDKTVSEESRLETLAQSAKEFQRGLLLIEKQVVMESSVDFEENKDATNLNALATNLQEMQKGLAFIEQNIILHDSQDPTTMTSEAFTTAAESYELKGLDYDVDPNLLIIDPTSDDSSLADVVSMDDRSTGSKFSFAKDNFALKDDDSVASVLASQHKDNSENVFSLLEEELSDSKNIEKDELQLPGSDVKSENLSAPQSPHSSRRDLDKSTEEIPQSESYKEYKDMLSRERGEKSSVNMQRLLDKYPEEVAMQLAKDQEERDEAARKARESALEKMIEKREKQEALLIQHGLIRPRSNEELTVSTEELRGSRTSLMSTKSSEEVFTPT